MCDDGLCNMQVVVVGGSVVRLKHSHVTDLLYLLYLKHLAINQSNYIPHQRKVTPAHLYLYFFG